MTTEFRGSSLCSEDSVLCIDYNAILAVYVPLFLLYEMHRFYTCASFTVILMVMVSLLHVSRQKLLFWSGCWLERPGQRELEVSWLPNSHAWLYFSTTKLNLSATCQVITSSIETEPFFPIVTFILGHSQDWEKKWEKNHTS